MAQNFLTRNFVKNDSTFTHWGIQVGKDYIQELDVQDGKLAGHVSHWAVPEKERATFLGTKNDGDPREFNSVRGKRVGVTSMTDMDIKEEGESISCTCPHMQHILTSLQAEKVILEMKSGAGISFFEKVTQFYTT